MAVTRSDFRLGCRAEEDALHATECGLNHHASTTLFTSTTRAGAGGPGIPRVDEAVHGAGVLIALLALAAHRAGLASPLGLLHVPLSRLSTTTTGLATRAPALPRTHFTIHRTLLGIAHLDIRGVVARLASEQWSLGDGAGAGLQARATRLGALGPRRPGQQLTVHGAGVAVALLGHGGGRARS